MGNFEKVDLWMMGLKFLLVCFVGDGKSWCDFCESRLALTLAKVQLYSRVSYNLNLKVFPSTSSYHLLSSIFTKTIKLLMEMSIIHQSNK